MMDSTKAGGCSRPSRDAGAADPESLNTEVSSTEENEQTANRKKSAGRFGSEALTCGIRVQVQPVFLADHSMLAERRYAFAYRIRISNESEQTVRLINRHWRIINAHGQVDEVNGDGVVGQQPTLEPGQSFEYASHSLLRTPWGTMEGSYGFIDENTAPFEVRISRFYLVYPAEKCVATA